MSVKDDIRKEALSELPITLGKLVKDTSATTVPAISNQLKRSSVNTDRQLEIRVQGIPESSDTSQLKRMEFDERHVSDVPKMLMNRIIVVFCPSVPFPRVAQSNLRTNAENSLKGVVIEVTVRKRLRMFQNFKFLKFDSDWNIYEK